MFGRVIKLAMPQTLTIRYGFTRWDWEYIPKPWNVPVTKKERRILYSKENNPFPKYMTNFNDTLYIAGLEGDKLLSLY